MHTYFWMCSFTVYKHHMCRDLCALLLRKLVFFIYPWPTFLFHVLHFDGGGGEENDIE